MGAIRRYILQLLVDSRKLWDQRRRQSKRIIRGVMIHQLPFGSEIIHSNCFWNLNNGIYVSIYSLLRKRPAGNELFMSYSLLIKRILSISDTFKRLGTPTKRCLGLGLVKLQDTPNKQINKGQRLPDGLNRWSWVHGSREPATHDLQPDLTPQGLALRANSMSNDMTPLLYSCRSSQRPIAFCTSLPQAASVCY